MHIRHPVGVGLVLLAGVALADQQQIAPGTGQQDSTVIDTGADGICNTTPAADDIQFAAVGNRRLRLTLWPRESLIAPFSLARRRGEAASRRGRARVARSLLRHGDKGGSDAA